MTVSSRVFLTVILTGLLPILSMGTVTQKAVADPLVVDLSNHLVAITTGFTGTKVLLFGAVEDEGDVIVTVRGPDQDMVVRKKERKVGIWVNSESARYKNIPAYYASASNRPMDIIAPPEVLLDYRIGLHNQRFVAESDLTDADKKSTARHWCAICKMPVCLVNAPQNQLPVQSAVSNRYPFPGQHTDWHIHHQCLSDARWRGCQCKNHTLGCLKNGG